MASEPIGTIPVEITGDFSKLDVALSQSVIAAELGGQKIGSAFGAAASGADKLEAAFEAVRKEIEEAGGQISKWDSSSASAAAAAVAAAGGIDKMAQAAQAATQPVVSLDQALADFGNSAQIKAQTDALSAAMAEFANTAGQQAAPAVQEVTTATFGWGDALKLLGIDFTARALKDFAVSALESFAAVEKATIAIGALTGSAEVAKSAINDLKNLSLSDALAFPELVRAEQRMIAFGFSTQQIPGLLRVVGDTSAAVGINFNQLANVFERVVETGNLQGRQLQQLGINIRDLATALHTTEDEASALFKSLDSRGRIEALELALAKFKGTAEQTAHSLSGQFQNLRTNLDFFLQDFGEAISPIATGVIGIGDAALKSADITAKGFAQIGASSKHLADALKETAKQAAENHSEFSVLYNKAVEASSGINKLDVEVAAATASLTALAPALSGAVGLLDGMARGFDAINQKAPDTLGLLGRLIVNLDALTHTNTTSSAAFKEAWERSQEYAKSLNAVHDAQSAANTALDLARRTLDAYTESFRQHKPLANGHIATQQEVNRATKDFETALDKANVKLKDQDGIFKEIAKGYKKFDGDLKAGVSSIGNTLAIANDLFTGGSRVIIGTFKEQGDAFAEWVKQEAIGAGKATAAFEVFQRKVDDVYPEITKLMNELGHWPSLSEQVAAGLTRIVGDLDKLKTSSDGARDAYGMLMGKGKLFYDILRESGTNAIQIVTELNQVVSGTGEVISSAMDKSTEAVTAFDKALEKAKDDWAAFKDSFSDDPTSGDPKSGKKKGAGNSYLNLENSSFNRQFNTGASLPPHTHLDYALWGISGARVVPDNGYYFDINGNVIESDWHALANGGTVANTTAPGSSVTAPAPAAQVPALPAAVQQFIDQFAGVSGTSFVSVTGGFERVADLLAKVAATGLIPPEAIQTLTSTLDTVVTSLDKNSGTLASFSPIIQQATTQVAAAVQQQAASFARLSDALAPVSAPAPINAGTPAAFQRLQTIQSSATNTVNNLSITATPRLQDIMTMMQDELQRMGVRW